MPVATADLQGLTEDLLGGHDGARVALLGQEQLAPEGELLVVGVSCHHGEEPRLAAVVLGPEHTPQTLGLFLPAAVRTRHRDGHRHLEQIDGEISRLGHHQDR